MRLAKHLHWGRAFVALTLLAAAITATPLQAADPVPTVKVLPSDVYMYFSVPSVEDMKARFNKTQMSKIRTDPAFKDVIAKIEKLVEKGSREFEEKSGLKLKELLELPTGEVAFALMKPPEGQLAAVAFVDFGKSEDTVDQLLKKLEDAMKKEDVDRKVQEFENTRIVIYKKAGGDDENTPVKQQFAYFVKDTQFVVSNDVSALESILNRWDGKAPHTFAENTIFKKIMEKCSTGNGTPVAQWFFDPMKSLDAAMTAGAQANPQVMMVRGVLPFLGVNGLRGMGGVTDMATGGFEGISKTMIYVDQPPQGLLNMFLFPATDLSPPKWVSDKTQAYMGLNWDVDSAYQAVDALMAIFQGAGALDRIIDDIADSPGGPGVHIKKDILDQLNGRFHMINNGAEIVENKPPKVKMLFSVGLRNAKSVQDLITKLIKNEGFPAETRMFRGETIVEFDGGDLKGGLSVFNNSLLITSDVSMLEEVIRGDRAQKPLADLPAYRQIAKAFPAKTSMQSFQQNDEQIKAIYEAARKGELGENDIDPEVQAIIDALPPFEALQKYLPIAGGYTVPDENGVVFVNLSQVKN